MDQLRRLLEDIKESLQRKCKDHSIVAQLAAMAKETALEDTNFDEYARIAVQLYDISNDSSLVTEDTLGKYSFDSQSMKMKVIVFQMLIGVMHYVQISQQHSRLPELLLKQALQIMIILSRLFLNEGKETAKDVVRNYSNCTRFYDFLSHQIEEYSKSKSEGQTTSSNKFTLMHHLNGIEVMKLCIDQDRFDVSEFKRWLISFDQKCRVKSDEQSVKFVSLMTMQVLLKLLKKGKTDVVSSLRSHLPVTYQQMIDSLVQFDIASLESGNSLHASPFLELYQQIKTTGIDSVSPEHLTSFLQINFADRRIFDVVALTRQPQPLEMWLSLHSSRKQRHQLLPLAYRCFIYLVDNEPCESFQSICVSEQFISLSRVVMLSLLNEKKEAGGDPILNLLKRLVRVAINLIINLYPAKDTLIDLLEKLTLVSSKHGYPQVVKTITCLGLFYELVDHSPTETCYNKFAKCNLQDKSSELCKMLKLAYQWQTGQTGVLHRDEQKDILLRQPHLVMLFCPQLHSNLILDLQVHEFAKLEGKFGIYLSLLRNEIAKLRLGSVKEVLKIVTHFSQVMIVVDFSQLHYNQSELQQMKDMLWEIVKLSDSQQSELRNKVSLALMYLFALLHCFSQIKCLSFSILNHYSKLVKLVQTIVNCLSIFGNTDKQQLLQLCKIVLVTILEVAKSKMVASINPLVPGELIFFEAIFKLAYTLEPAIECQEYLSFVNFELHSIADSLDDNDILLENNLRLLRLYCGSKYIRESSRLKILRKIVREDSTTDGQGATLRDYQELLRIAKDQKEKILYAQQIIRLFGEDGRKFLFFLAEKTTEEYEFLLRAAQGDN